MALFRGAKLALNLARTNPASMIVPVRNHWNKDFKPGKYPETEAERLAAAKKYNMHPDEYQPYPDDGEGYGDYPKLPDEPVEMKDPYYPYDFPELKRNFNEPVHIEYTLWSEDRFGYSEKPRFSLKYQFLMFTGVLAACFGIYYFLEDYKVFRPVVPKQLPGDGKVHYTFESK
ncbi:NADH dehydrogenase [ubiquinone] 1 beta subcomplex subunit 8, mitochondrial [Phlebotomus papatasi]|uniref:NADH dehydrogenase [ubiquinone] 1 beta subcomplex subunit 8, mitochondrial n=1 Tax=Phlebotomus papatasi TaxID=29031 RepID=UPI0024834E99|nr:NADH dehydrogenase [ubiquinone] 1 beta subcomplex subunit 8, mitochondrial [Phlebotomus papatasi]